MHHDYADIRNRIAEPPKWWDEYAVPRYCEFSPREVADIYAETVVLYEIACQGCGTRFQVAETENTFDRARHPGEQSLETRVRDGSLHYGDPPNVGCCDIGPSMNCLDVRVLRFFRRNHQYDVEFPQWVRDRALEIPLGDCNDLILRTPPEP